MSVNVGPNSVQSKHHRFMGFWGSVARAGRWIASQVLLIEGTGRCQTRPVPPLKPEDAVKCLNALYFGQIWRILRRIRPQSSWRQLTDFLIFICELATDLFPIYFTSTYKSITSVFFSKIKKRASSACSIPHALRGNHRRRRTAC